MHQPETWGYVQFSGAAAESDPGAAGGGNSRGGEGGAAPTFVPDASWPLRCFLMEGYRLQKVGRVEGSGIRHPSGLKAGDGGVGILPLWVHSSLFPCVHPLLAMQAR